MKDWEKYFEGILYAPALRFLRQYFRHRDIKEPTIKDILSITHDELERSWLSVRTQKEILLIQQHLRDNEKSLSLSGGRQKNQKDTE